MRRYKSTELFVHEAAESAGSRRAQSQRRSVRYVFRIPRVENVSEADKQELSKYICDVLKELSISVAWMCCGDS